MATVTVRINGMEYNLKGKEDEEYLHHLASHVEDKLQEILQKNTKLSVSAASILTAINLADESFKAKKELNVLLGNHDVMKKDNKVIKNELDGIKEKYAIAIRAEESKHLNITENFKKEITSLKNEHSKETISLKNRYSKENEILKNGYLKENEKLKSEYSNVNETLKTEFQKKTEDFKNEIVRLKDETQDAIKAKEAIKIEKTDVEETNMMLILEKQRLEEDKLELQDELNSEMQNNSSGTLEVEVEELRKQLSLVETKNEKLEKANHLLKKSRREIKFGLQSSKYRIIDLENKFLESQLAVVAEKVKNNPMLLKKLK